MSQRDVLAEIREFKGLWLDASGYNFLDGYSDVAVNVVVAADGSVRMRPGIRALSRPITSLAWNNTLINDPIHIHTHVTQKAPNTSGAPEVSQTIPIGVERQFSSATGTAAVIRWSPPVAAADVLDSGLGHSTTPDVTWARTDTALGSVVLVDRAMSFASIAGVLYACMPGQQVRRLRFSEDAGNWSVDMHSLQTPDENPRTYNKLELGINDNDTADNYADDTWERQEVTTQSSWSEDFDNPFADLYNTDRNAGRFPISDIILAVSAGGSDYMFSARDSRVRWSHPTRWLDSGYFGITSGTTGDPGPDWPDEHNVFPNPEKAPMYPSGIDTNNLPSWATLYENNTHDNSKSVADEDATLRLFGPEDWSLYNFVDIAPTDGDYITAMVHHFDTLLVFKRRSLYGLTGSIPDNLELVAISGHVGTVNQHSAISTPYGVFFFSYPDGVFLWKPDGTLLNVSDQLGEWDNKFSDTSENLSLVSLGYHDGKVFLSVPWANPANDQDAGITNTFVYDVLTEIWTEWSVCVFNYIEPRWAGLADELLIYSCDPTTGNRVVCRLLPPGSDEAFDAFDVGRPTAGNPISAQIAVKGVHDRELPDSTSRWRRSKIEMLFDGLRVPPPPRPPVRFRTWVDNERSTWSFLTPDAGINLIELPTGKRGRYYNAHIYWSESSLVLVSALFTWWRTRRRSSKTGRAT